MAQVNPVSGNNSTSFDPSQLSSLDNNQITTLLVNGSLDPKFAVMLMNQMSTNNVDSILFGNQTGNDQSSNIDFGVSNLTPNNIPGTTNVNDTFGASAFSNVTPQFQLSVYSSLIGKNVTAVDPLSGKQISGKVSGVQLQNGQVILNLSGTLVPTGNVVKIQ
jgi:hypothetical protein